MDWFQNITGFKELDYMAIQALLRVAFATRRCSSRLLLTS